MREQGELCVLSVQQRCGPKTALKIKLSLFILKSNQQIPKVSHFSTKPFKITVLVGIFLYQETTNNDIVRSYFAAT